ncbi:MAG: nicotinamide mononucleotide transporter [Lewinella sp.]|nr:nicotinamide mononucleotide transporter [Lewinella sp.]
MGWLDWTATVLALVYVILAARDTPWCWPFGMISCALWAWASFYQYDLWLDAGLQLFYVVMGAVGLYRWIYGGQQGEGLPITQGSWWDQWPYLLSGSVLAVVFGLLFSAYTPAAATYWDAFTTIFSVLATWLLVQRRIENWIYWIITDAIYVGLYYSRGAYLFAVLMCLYVIIAAGAWRNWRRLQLAEEAH